MSRHSPQKVRVTKTIILLTVISACLACIVLLLPTCVRRVGETGAVDSRASESTPAEPAPPEPADPVPVEPAPIEPLPSGRAPRVAVVIDDAGYSLQTLEPFLQYPGALTIAVLPNLPLSRETARMVAEAGKELIVHLPMEPVGGEDPGPGAIMTDQDEETILALLDRCFESVPGAAGANNHMGSLAMSDDRVMRVVMRYFSEHGKFFLDSSTTPDSRAPEWARYYGVPLLKRDVFLDNDASRISSRLDEGLEMADRQETTVLIGHVKSPEILIDLSSAAPSWEEDGGRIVPLAELLEEREGTVR